FACCQSHADEVAKFGFGLGARYGTVEIAPPQGASACAGQDSNVVGQLLIGLKAIVRATEGFETTGDELSNTATGIRHERQPRTRDTSRSGTRTLGACSFGLPRIRMFCNGSPRSIESARLLRITSTNLFLSSGSGNRCAVSSTAFNATAVP